MKIRALVWIAPAVLACSSAMTSASLAPTPTANLRSAMRALWEQHVEWTRMFITSAAAGAADKDVVTQRLLQNQTDIGNAIASYYGRAAGDKLTSLLRDHILIAADIVAAAKAGDNAQVSALTTKWRGNATDIANFLHSANPDNWPAATIQSLMFTHLDQTIAEATHRLQGNYAADVADYDAIEKHILTLADALTNGIVAQFPNKFSAGP